MGMMPWGLSDEEVDILFSLYEQGSTWKQIQAALEISSPTVKYHLDRNPQRTAAAKKMREERARIHAEAKARMDPEELAILIVENKRLRSWVRTLQRRNEALEAKLREAGLTIGEGGRV